MKLFHSPSSPYVRKVAVVAYETGQEFEIHAAAPRPTSRDANLVAMNPLGKIPTAILDDGSVLYDSRVITRWLDAQHSGPKLYPEGDALWPALRREAMADGMLEAALLIRYETVQRPQELRWPDWVKGQEAKIQSAFEQLEREAGDLAGVDVGLIAIGCAIGFIDFRFPDWGWRQTRPELASWYEEFVKRPSMQETIPTDHGRLPPAR